jgi:hypothetical protein
MDAEATAEEVLEAVGRVAAEAMASAAVTAPPVDAFVLLARFGIAVVVGRRGSRSPRGLAVILDVDWSEERRQWAAAQAVGARFCGEVLGRLGAPRDDRGSLGAVSLSNLLAVRLLLPTDWFGADAAACGYDLLELKHRYNTASHELIAWRMLDLPAGCVVTVVADGKVVRRRSNGGRVSKALGVAEQECLRLVRDDDEPHVVRAEGWTVRGWPIQRESVDRVILRSVGDES